MERETMCIQAGYTPKNGESRMIPIIQSTTFKYDTGEYLKRRKKNGKRNYVHSSRIYAEKR